MMLFKDKRILITGASHGIGREIALTCAREGAIVGIGYHSSKGEAIALQEEIGERFDRRSSVLGFDVCNSSQVANSIKCFVEMENTIDALVNNAGIPSAGLLITQAIDTICYAIDVNLLGPIYCTKAVLPEMVKKRSGVILNVSSVASTKPTKGQTVYAATKGGIESFTRAVAVEYGRKGIRINCVRLGPIDTDMMRLVEQVGFDAAGTTALRRYGTVSEVAELAVFLLSNKASYITGAIYSLDGGSC
jgi:3-oxoacyl-[acyl-carrier protein] reductase